jgi:hypothetical protein
MLSTLQMIIELQIESWACAADTPMTCHQKGTRWIEMGKKLWKRAWGFITIHPQTTPTQKFQFKHVYKVICLQNMKIVHKPWILWVLSVNWICISNQIEGNSCKLSVLSPYKIQGDKIQGQKQLGNRVIKLCTVYVLLNLDTAVPLSMGYLIWDNKNLWISIHISTLFLH